MAKMVGTNKAYSMARPGKGISQCSRAWVFSLRVFVFLKHFLPYYRAFHRDDFRFFLGF